MNDHAYWKYEFTYEYAGKSQRELKSELSELLVASVRRKASAKKPIVLSLSVGYDVAGVLAVKSGVEKYRYIFLWFE
jgi:asparagine synthetase B (glutamine-hydrolysing)